MLWSLPGSVTAMHSVGLSLKTTLKLQVVQHAESWADSRFHHVTPLAQELHWLLIFHVRFKVPILTLKVLFSLGPKYLAHHLTLNISVWPLRPDREGFFGFLSQLRFSCW